MKETKINIIMHPIRMKIIQKLFVGKRLTVQQINEQLPDVPPATMYRHLNKLLSADLIKVVDENQIRGTVEKVYSLVDSTKNQIDKELIDSPKDEQLNYFFTFLLNILSDYEKFLNQEDSDHAKDGVGYSQAFIYADEDEFTMLISTIKEAIIKVSTNKPSQSRKARTISTIVMPYISDNKK